jgi:hypothetical protein
MRMLVSLCWGELVVFPLRKRHASPAAAAKALNRYVSSEWRGNDALADVARITIYRRRLLS